MEKQLTALTSAKASQEIVECRLEGSAVRIAVHQLDGLGRKKKELVKSVRDKMTEVRKDASADYHVVSHFMDAVSKDRLHVFVPGGALATAAWLRWFLILVSLAAPRGMAYKQKPFLGFFWGLLVAKAAEPLILPRETWKKRQAQKRLCSYYNGNNTCTRYASGTAVVAVKANIRQQSHGHSSGLHAKGGVATPSLPSIPPPNDSAKGYNPHKYQQQQIEWHFMLCDVRHIGASMHRWVGEDGWGCSKPHCLLVQVHYDLIGLCRYTAAVP